MRARNLISLAVVKGNIQTKHTDMTARVLLFSVLVPLLIISCKKTTPVVPPTPAVAEVQVLLKHPYMKGDKIDSAVATWTVGNIKQHIKLRVHHDTLSAIADTLTAGTGQLTVYLYSKIKFSNHYISHWILNKAFTNDGKSNISVEGPSGYSDMTWSPRVVLKDGVGNLAIVGMRPEDPYFFVKGVQDNVRELKVAREYWKTKGGIMQVGGREWSCKTNCRNEKGDVENTDFYKFLPTQIGTRAWNHIEIIVLYLDSPNGGYSLNFSYDVE